MAETVTINETNYTVTITEGDQQTVVVTPAAAQSVTISTTQGPPGFTDADARDAISVSGAGLSYNNTTGVISFLQPVVSIEKGGTGSTTASTARSAIGANNAANLDTGILNNDRLANIPVSKLAGTLQNSQVAESNVTQHATAVGNAIDLGDLANVNIPILTDGQVLTYDQSIDTWVAGSASGGSGTVTSVALTVPTGFTVAGSPVTSSGTLAISTTLNGIVKGDGSGFSAATAGVDYAAVSHNHTLSDITDAGTAAASNTGDFEAAGAVSTHAAVTSGVHGISSFGSTLVDDADAATARTTLGLGDLAVADSLELNDLDDVNIATGAGNDGDLVYWDYAPGAGAKFKGAARSSISLSEFNDDLDYAASTHTHLIADVTDISAFAATILDDADAAAARTTLGAAATNHNHSATQITSGTFDNARIASSNVTQHAADIDIQDLGNVVPGLLSDNLFLAYNNGTSTWTGRSPAAARTALGLGTAATSDTGDFAAASHTHAATDITSGTLDAARLPAISDAYIMVIETPSDQTYPLDPYLAEDRTISRLTVKTDSGTCTVAIAKNAGTAIGSLAASSSQNTTTSLTNTSCVAGDRIYITISSTSSADMLEIAVEYTQ